MALCDRRRTPSAPPLVPSARRGLQYAWLAGGTAGPTLSRVQRGLLPLMALPLHCSGGKDSCYSMVLCERHGHEVVALANLLPAGQDTEDMDSYMYQTVGHQVIAAYAECLTPLGLAPIVFVEARIKSGPVKVGVAAANRKRYQRYIVSNDCRISSTLMSNSSAPAC